MKEKNKLALVVGFYLSKFDDIAYKNLGYKAIIETHKKIGKNLGVKASTIQNMRDEFDPYHSNSRKGWWQRGLTPSRQAVKNQFDHYSEPELRRLVQMILNNSPLPSDVSKKLAAIKESSKKNDVLEKDWSDEESAVAIDSYLYLLRLELSGVPFSIEDIAKFLAEKKLTERNNASIRYRMRNISHVLDTRELPILKAYSPAPNIGSGVKKRIEKLLDERSDNLLQILERSKKAGENKTETLNTILTKLNKLEDILLGMEDKSMAGMGHNNPPEPIEDFFFDVTIARESVQNIKEELNSVSPNKEKIEKEQSLLIKFGLDLASSAKMHLSLFTKSAAMAAGAGIGAKALELAPHIADALEALSSFIRALG